MNDLKICIDSEDFSEEERNRLESALFGLAQGEGELCAEILLVSEEEIQRLNREIRGRDAVTDVLSFPALELVPGEPILAGEHGEALDEEDRLLIGSIAICKKRAEEQAEEYGHSFERELNFLAVHGVLHCLGYDHETDDERAQMRAKEEEVMKKMGLGRDL